jgi:hypothetical protein
MKTPSSFKHKIKIIIALGLVPCPAGKDTITMLG